MFPVSTPVNVFRVGIEVDTIDMLELVYSQFGKILIEKNEADVKMEGNTISVELSQEETAKFSHIAPVRVQIRALTKDGKLLPTKVVEIPIEEVLSRKVLRR